MQRPTTRTLLLALAALALCLGLTLPSAAAAGERLSDLTWNGPEGAAVSPQQQGGKTWLFLPASADLSALTLTFEGGPITLSAGGGSAVLTSGQPFDLTALTGQSPAEGTVTVTLTRGQASLELSLLQSQNLSALFLTSQDPAKDRLWVEQDKENKAKGAAVLLGADGTEIWSGDLKQIKGRGNSTWLYPKKPYQIKLSKAADLLETGDPTEAASTWVLLANYCDESLLHNQLTYDLAAQFNLPYSPHCKPVDLYYDGEYRGSYLLSEKTEVGTGRVEVADLEGAIEDANPQAEDLDDLPTAQGVSQRGNQYQYVTGLTTPEDYSGGYLLELDFASRAQAEKSWFVSASGKYVVCKSPEYLPQDAMEYISSLWQDFEDAVVNGGTHPVTGLDYTDYVDLDSLARCYLILELSQDGDAFQSSTFFYKPAGEEKLYAGPVWDFDSAYGSYDRALDPEALTAGQTYLGRKLLSIPSFRAAVQQCYEELYPLVEEVALSGQSGTQAGRLGTLLDYGARLAASQRMDHVLWPKTTPGSYQTAVQNLQTWLAQRNQWLYSQVMGWTEDTVFPACFADVPLDAWYTQAVEDVVAQGLFSGVSELLFRPNASMTRGMMVTVLYRLAGEPEVQGTAFSDVAEADWYGPAAAWAAETGVAQGYPDGTFQPNRAVTRQELVTLLCRRAQASGADIAAPPIPAAFADRDQVPDWAEEAFGWAIDRGVLTGTKPDTLSPQALATRCQGAALFQRFSQLLDQ